MSAASAELPAPIAKSAMLPRTSLFMTTPPKLQATRNIIALCHKRVKSQCAMASLDQQQTYLTPYLLRLLRRPDYRSKALQPELIRSEIEPTSPARRADDRASPRRQSGRPADPHPDG